MSLKREKSQLGHGQPFPYTMSAPNSTHGWTSIPSHPSMSPPNSLGLHQWNGPGLKMMGSERSCRELQGPVGLSHHTVNL